MRAFHEALRHLNPQLWGGQEALCVCLCDCVCVCAHARMTAWPALLYGTERECFWTSVCFGGGEGLRNVLVCVSTRLVCAFVASLLVCVLYLCPTLVPFTVIPVPHSRAEPIYSVIHKPGDSKVPQALYRGFCPSSAPLCQGPLPFSGRYKSSPLRLA